MPKAAFQNLKPLLLFYHTQCLNTKKPAKSRLTPTVMNMDNGRRADALLYDITL